MSVSLQNAFLGSLVADSVSMPVHWYYNVQDLDKDYGEITDFMSPKNPHPDSILWRSHFDPKSPKSDILHGQKKYWGKRGVHYHQHLKAGENTLNQQLSAELYRFIILHGEFSIEHWLQRYVQVMLTPGWHNDTYAEEYHRAFFENYAKGKPLLACGVSDYHIGALSLIPGLLAGLEAIGQTDPALLMESVLTLVRSTHDNSKALQAATDLTRILIQLNQNHSVRDTIESLPLAGISVRQLNKWEKHRDRDIIGGKISTACYLPESFLASLFFCWKYHDDFSKGVLGNAMVGGDNCHRGVVVGSILGIHNEVSQSWLKNLKMMNRLRCDAQLLESNQLSKRES